MDDLKPCPFCGGKAHISRDYETEIEGDGVWTFVKCGTCGSRAREKYYSKGNDCPQTYEDVRAAWNTRTAPKVKPLEWGVTSYGTPEAITICGAYRVTNAHNGGYACHRYNYALQSENGLTNFPTMDSAKAAAQADYERRILSALEDAQTKRIER